MAGFPCDCSKLFTAVWQASLNKATLEPIW